MKLSKMLMSGIAAAALAAPALADDYSTERQRQQYLYDQTMKQQGGDSGTTLSGAQADNQGAIGATKPTSGPGVQGPEGTRTGPAAKAPGSDSSSSGASSGESGSGAGDMNSAGSSNGAAATTQPSQDSSGVQGFPDTRTGPATKGSGSQ